MIFNLFLLSYLYCLKLSSHFNLTIQHDLLSPGKLFVPNWSDLRGMSSRLARGTAFCPSLSSRACSETPFAARGQSARRLPLPPLILFLLLRAHHQLLLLRVQMKLGRARRARTTSPAWITQISLLTLRRGRHSSTCRPALRTSAALCWSRSWSASTSLRWRRSARWVSGARLRPICCCWARPVASPRRTTMSKKICSANSRVGHADTKISHTEVHSARVARADECVWVISIVIL